jgi:hypothetical protein
MIVTVSAHLRESAPVAVARLSYLYPKLRFAETAQGIEVSGEIADEENLKREVNYALYRQHIFERSLAARTALLATLSNQ